LSAKDKDGKRKATCVYTRLRSTEELTKRLGGKVGMNSVKPFQNGFLNSYSRNFNKPQKYADFVAGLVSDPFHWSDVLHIPTKTAHEWWKKEGTEAFETERRKRLDQREKVSRRIVIGCRASVRPHIPEELQGAFDQFRRWMPNLERKIVRPYALATVTRQTATRVYIEDIEKVNPHGRFAYGDVPVQGNAPNQYVDISTIMADHVSDHGAMKLIELDLEYAEDIARISGESLAKIIPIISQLDLRQAQKEAERLDMMRELIEGLGKEKSADTQSSSRKP
jgi:hypothetical protein